MKTSIFILIACTSIFSGCASNDAPTLDTSFVSKERSIASSNKLEDEAIKNVKDFILTFTYNSGSIHRHGGWDKLLNELKEKSSPDLINSILNNTDEASFNKSLVNIMRIGFTGQALNGLSSEPTILETIAKPDENKTIFKIRPFNGRTVDIYETTCTQQEMKNFLRKSIKYSCKVTGIESPGQ